jgi:threonine/homoserine/homoserine lactone efflux protein
MGELLLNFIPLALAAITPAMLAAVTFLLSLERGPMRAGMFMAGRLLAYVGWCTILFIFTDRVFNLTLDGPPTFRLLLKSILGLLLVAMAVKIALGGDDPEALPSKLVELFTRMSFLQLFGLGVLVSLFQVRHILLMFVGVTEIVIAELSIIKMLLSTLMLIVMINASQLILIGVYLFISDRADRVLQSIDAWINRNNHRVAAIVSLIGIFLLWDGISSLMTI